MSDYLNKIIQRASLKKAIFFTMLFAVFFVLINFSSIGVAGLLSITGGASILDFEFGFTYETAYYMLTALGEEGRTFYLTRLLPLDFPFPFTVMLFGVGYMALLLKHIAPKRPYKYLLILPVLFMVFDWIENIGIIIMLLNFPNLPVWAALLASISGMLKYISSFGSIVAISVLFIIFLYSKRRAK